jgi:magnesium chelatase family protein
MSLAEALETTRIPRVAGRTGARGVGHDPPVSCPASDDLACGWIGGGHLPMLGEVSLAHHGMLFLDELPEFRRHVLEVLRQPLEESVI